MPPLKLLLLILPVVLLLFGLEGISYEPIVEDQRKAAVQQRWDCRLPC